MPPNARLGAVWRILESAQDGIAAVLSQTPERPYGDDSHNRPYKVPAPALKVHDASLLLRLSIRLIIFVRPGKAARASLLLLKDPLREKIEVVLPFRGVVRVPVYVPHMRDAFLLQVGVNALTDAEQAVLAAARHPQQL